MPIGCTRQEVGSLHLLETTLHSLQQTYLRPSIHTTHNWLRCTLTTLNYHNCKHLYTSSRQHIHALQNTYPDIQHCIQYTTNIPHSVLTGDVNSHSTLWYSHTDDHTGQLIADPISNSDHITLNNNQSTKHHTTTKIITRYHYGV